MKVCVVYESMYGNTAAVGEAVAAALREHGVDVVSGPVTEIPAAEAAGAELLILGSPTHVHGMTRPSTRKAGANDTKNAYEHPTLSPGLREWIDDLAPNGEKLAAAFDTRFDKPVLLTGSAAKGIAKRLSRRSFHLVTAPESFFVSTQNRLLDGEIAHARRWANALLDHPSLPVNRAEGADIPR